MHGVRKIASRKWEKGVRQPYNQSGEYDFSQAPQFKRLRDAQVHTEQAEKDRPRRSTMRTEYHDRRGL